MGHQYFEEPRQVLLQVHMDIENFCMHVWDLKCAKSMFQKPHMCLTPIGAQEKDSALKDDDPQAHALTAYLPLPLSLSTSTFHKLLEFFTSLFLTSINCAK